MARQAKVWIVGAMALLIGVMLGGRVTANPKEPGVFIEGTLISIDTETISIRLHDKKGHPGKTTIRMVDSTTITLDGSPAVADALKAGMKVKVHDLGGKAAEVEAQSEKKKGK